MNFIINDFNIYYEKYGNGPNNILILPGWGNTRATFIRLINVLKSNDNTIYILDYPGFGNSSFPSRDLSIYDYARLINDFINSQGIQDNLSIIAHSFGGRITILLEAIHNIKLKHLIMMDTAGIRHKKPFKVKLREKTYKFLKKLKIVLPKKLKDKYNNFLIKIFASPDYKDLNPNIRNTFIKIVNEDLTKYIDKINCDTLIIWGEKDESTPLKDAYILKSKIKDSELIIIPKAHHFPYLEYSCLVNSIIYECLK